MHSNKFINRDVFLLSTCQVLIAENKRQCFQYLRGVAIKKPKRRHKTYSSPITSETVSNSICLLRHPCTAPTEFSTVQNSAGNPLLSARWESLAL